MNLSTWLDFVILSFAIGYCVAKIQSLKARVDKLEKKP